MLPFVADGMGFAPQSADASAIDGSPKDWVRLFPIGVIQGRDGRGPYRLDDLAHAQRVVASSLSAAGGTDIPVDYDHQIPFGVRDGVAGNAPAAGWIKALAARVDGIWAKIDWTAAATAKIKAREYRYISPYFSFDSASGSLTRIWNAGLLNLPNFTELAAVAGADFVGQDAELVSLGRQFGLNEGALAAALAAFRATNAARAAEELAIAAAATDLDAPLSAGEKACAARMNVSEIAFRDSKRQLAQSRY